MKRRSAGITPVRAGALLALLVAAGGLYGAVSSDVFATRSTPVTGNTWTSDADVLAAVDVPERANVFTIRSGDLEARAVGLPSIRGASVSIALPDEVRIQVTEREPLLVWGVGERRFLVDAEGLLFAELGDDPPAAAASLPVVGDSRAEWSALTVGSTLDSVTLDAALRLGSLAPADVGSAGRGLGIRLDDSNGFTMRGDPAGWEAIFGFYTPTLRPTDLVPGQVRLLRSLLADHGEDTIQRAILADDGSGTYVPRPTPRPSSTPKP